MVTNKKKKKVPLGYCVCLIGKFLVHPVNAESFNAKPEYAVFTEQSVSRKFSNI